MASGRPCSPRLHRIGRDQFRADHPLDGSPVLLGAPRSNARAVQAPAIPERLRGAAGPPMAFMRRLRGIIPPPAPASGSPRGVFGPASKRRPRLRALLPRCRSGHRGEPTLSGTRSSARWLSLAATSGCIAPITSPECRATGQVRLGPYVCTLHLASFTEVVEAGDDVLVHPSGRLFRMSRTHGQATRNIQRANHESLFVASPMAMSESNAMQSTWMVSSSS
jgi:hypothetical protein